MKISKLLALGLLLLVTPWLTATASAQGRFNLFSRAKPVTNEALELSAKSGPWLIMCASFTGEEGRQQAKRLASELREKHRLNAYVYSHRFDISAKINALSSNSKPVFGWEAVELPSGETEYEPTRMKPAGPSAIEEIAVLVGDFPSIDDGKAQRTLKQIQTLNPESMENYDLEIGQQADAATVARVRAVREASKQRGQTNDNSAGPLKLAFMLPNPMLPDEYFEARKFDEAVMNWEANRVKYSLLRNPGSFTVKIATFGGEEIFEADKMQRINEEDSWRRKSRAAREDSKLMNAAKKATVLAIHLRNEGVEAYEFHDRHESYVCVGSFDWLTKENADGLKVQNPEIVEVIKRYQGKQTSLPGRSNAMAAYKLPDNLERAGITCDLQPLPVLVPKARPSVGKKFFGRLR